MSAAQNHLDVDPENVNWQSFGSYTGFRYYLLNVDVENRVIDLMFQFDANEKCFYHAHHQPSSTLVLQGEQHIWEKDEKGTETHKVRRVGEFGISNQKEVHIEGGGADGGVCRLRGEDGAYCRPPLQVLVQASNCRAHARRLHAGHALALALLWHPRPPHFR